MDIIYLGHSCFKIKTAKTSLIIDPFDPGFVGLKLPMQEADAVVITHDHADHNHVSLVKNTRKVINGPGEYEVGGISILGLASYHDDKKGEKRGENVIYIFEAQDLRLLHLGDIGHKLSEKQIEDIGEINILMLPTGGVYTVGPSLAVEIVRQIEPQITIPMHYFTPNMNKENFGKLEPLDNFLKEVGLPVERVIKLQVKSVDLGEEQKVVVF